MVKRGSIREHLQSGHPAEVVGVVSYERQRIRQRSRGNPQIIRANEQVLAAQVLRRDGVLVGSCLIHGHNVKTGQHGGASRVMNVTEAFGKFTCDDPSQAGT